MNLDLLLVKRPCLQRFPNSLQRNIDLIRKKSLKIKPEYGIFTTELCRVCIDKYMSFARRYVIYCVYTPID